LAIPLKDDPDLIITKNAELIDQLKTEYAVYYLKMNKIPATGDYVKIVKERY
jgi:hypothetical protein